jgi:drug/metabolite transporter (DMT)-like permease
MTAPARGTPVTAVVSIGLLWGLNWPAVKYLLTEIPPLTIRAASFPAAALVLAVIARSLGQRLIPPSEERWPIVVTGMLVVFGFNVSTTLGQMLTETSKAVIIAYTMPGLTVVLAAIFLRERLTPRLVAAVGLGMAGLAVLASENFGALLAEPLGPAIMFVAALSWAAGNVALKARSWTLKPLALTVWFFVVSAIVCAALALVFEPPWQQRLPSPPVLAVLGYHIVGPMVTCYALWTIIVGSLPASVAAITALLAPVVGLSSAVILLGEPISWQKVAALVLVLASIVLALLPTRPATS